MELFEIIAVLVTLAALFGFLNYKFLKLPYTIGLMLFSLVLSLVSIILEYLGVPLKTYALALVESIDFNKTLMEGMLGFLLFAGALHVNINDLLQRKWSISLLASIGLLLSTFLIGGLVYTLFSLFSIPMPFIYCLLFGALISPTDPIAVLGILKKAKVPKSLETKFTGESLFNDGIAVVVFLTIIGIATGHHDVTPLQITGLFLLEFFGGIGFGLLTGGLVYFALKKVDDSQLEIMLTLALVTGGYSIASLLHLSGPLAMVVAGLMIGNRGRRLAMSDHTRLHLDSFWEQVDVILNALLFILIGLEMLILTLSGLYILLGLIAIPIVLFARFVSIGIPISVLRMRKEFSPHAIKILTWGGLRGGISVALALSIPAGVERDMIVTITYVVVVFSIIVQGLTIGKVAKNSGTKE